MTVETIMHNSSSAMSSMELGLKHNRYPGMYKTVTKTLLLVSNVQCQIVAQ